MRLKNKGMIYDLFFKGRDVTLESEDIVGGCVTFHMKGKLGEEKLYSYMTGWMSYYEKEEIDGCSLNDAVDYIWKERKRYIEDN